MRPLRLTIIITGLGIGGAEHALLKLLAAIDRQRIQVSLIVLGRLDTLVPQFRAIGIEPVVLGLASGRWPFGEIGRLLQSVRAQDPDLLQGWMYHGNLAASFVGARIGRPVCWSVRDTPDAAHGHSRFTRATIALSRWYLGRVACIFNVSRKSAEYCAQKLGWPAERTEVLPNGLDLGHFCPDPAARAALRTELGIGAGEMLVGMVARWSPVKNHALFLQAFAALRDLRPGVRAVLVGKGCDADNGELMSLLDALALRSSVALLGPRHDVARLYPGLDLLALSSRSEGFPNVLAEAMACGVPVVSTDVGDAAEIVGSTGMIAAADPDAFAHAMAEVLADPRRAGRGQAARARIADNYAIAGIAERLSGCYRRIAASDANA